MLVLGSYFDGETDDSNETLDSDWYDKTARDLACSIFIGFQKINQTNWEKRVYCFQGAKPRPNVFGGTHINLHRSALKLMLFTQRLVILQQS